MIHSIENELIKIQVNQKGAELVNFYDKEKKIELMWNADSKFWAKTSPVLFPIVGALKDNQYEFEGQNYSLSRHGFAREMIFELEKSTENSMIFLLKNDKNTELNYPFQFELRLIYQIEKTKLTVTYSVLNKGESVMFFSIGGHPAFAIPQIQDADYQDFCLEFNQSEDFKSWILTAEGLVKNSTKNVVLNSNKIALTKALFYEDALVFKNLKSTSVKLKSDKNNRAFTFNFEGFPYLGIWAAKDANFVCIEPWCGIADAENHNKKLSEKEGIIKLNPNDRFQKSWSVEV